MSNGRNLAIADAIELIRPRGAMIAYRIIAPGDEEELLDAEAVAFRECVISVRRRSGAARIAARQLMSGFGLSNVAIPRSASGAPVWPTGLVGSLAHDDTIALAAVASIRSFAGIGIDVEPAIPLPPELIELVSTTTERNRYASNVIESRILFVVKEAIYKAQYSLDGAFLDFHDIEVDLDEKCGLTRVGRTVMIAVTTFPRIMASAFIPACLNSAP